MGKFFRMISPVDIFKEHIIKNKPLPNLYEEFNCRLVYWPILLSFPLKYTEDRVELHKFRAALMLAGTIIFFLIGFKLSGIAGGVLASAFWTSTPILNYWGHFFMTENPSFIFLAAGFLFLLYSDRFFLASFLGGILIGIAGLTRFTTLAIAIPAPLIIIAVFFHPFKRRSFQITGELAKAFSGFCFIILPYLIFTWWLFRNPLVPFISARSAVNNFLVNDNLYYIKNLWLESGFFLKAGTLLSFSTPIIMGLGIMFRKIIKDSKLNDIQEEKKQSILKLIHSKIKPINYIRIFSSALIYYSIIIFSLIITSAIYLAYISNVPHKLPRYLMGAIIPLILVSSCGLGSLESLFLNLFRYLGNSILHGFKKINKKNSIKKILPVVACSFGLIGTTIIFFNLTFNLWQYQMNRSFDVPYIINKNAEKELIKKGDQTSLKRLQPEYLQWKESINARLSKPGQTGIDDTDYHSGRYRTIIKYLNENAKADEVFYVDRLNQTPFTPAYTELPTMYIESAYNNTIEQLIKKGELSYRGYVLINNDANNDIYKENGEFYVRSLNKIQIKSNKKFKFIKNFGFESLYFFDGKSFDYKFGTKKRIQRLYSKNFAKTPKQSNKSKKSFFREIKSTLSNLFQF